ncbi:UDP-glucose 4-epimerase GalE [bacterium]|jgi:UDP-glucose 4-epimerase|nr:UDP-glucose 4-epimerase GalE [bacterium]
MKKAILVTGGAGYIGSHTAYALAQNGYHPVIIDKLVYNQPVNLPWATFVKADIGDKEALHKIFSSHKIEAVMHFAAHLDVGRSVREPAEFYHNNVVNTHTLLESMREHKVNKIIFSSSCTVYGIPEYLPLDEQHKKGPISPYGHTKQIIEDMLEDYKVAYDLSYVSLRYFNAAGGLPEQGLGEFHDPEVHLIPLVIRALRNDLPFNIFGNDYATADGTCVRDYVHVMDLAQGHLLALKYLEAGRKSDAFNLGTGTGLSIQQVISAAEKLIGKKLEINFKDRRPGDAARLVANSAKARSVLRWKPHHSSITEIIRNALDWENIINPILEVPSENQTQM